jgi:hypothetical protein
VGEGVCVCVVLGVLLVVSGRPLGEGVGVLVAGPPSLIGIEFVLVLLL